MKELNENHYLRITRYRPPRDLSNATVEEVAAAVYMRESSQNPGVMFARKGNTAKKMEAREVILQQFSWKAWPNGLSILTLPGLRWHFEHDLLKRREGRYRRYLYKNEIDLRPKRTFICGLEREEEIFRASLLGYMPGHQHSLAALQKKPPFATGAVRSYWIARYYCCTFETLVDQAADIDIYDGAWLDFNGPITTPRLERIIKFWKDHCRWKLAVTALKARYDKEMSAALEEMNWPELLTSKLGGKLVSHLEYNDPVPMIQMVFEK